MRSIARITALFASNFYFLSPIITIFLIDKKTCSVSIYTTTIPKILAQSQFS